MKTPTLGAWRGENLRQQGRCPGDAAGNEGLAGNGRASRLERSRQRKSAPFSPAPDYKHTDSGFFVYAAIVGHDVMTLHDKFGRQITDLRISVTDRCNFRCVYCRSADPENYRDHDEILSWPELDRLARVFLGLGIRKIRITGGEPLVRQGVEDYIARLHALGVEDLSMTTNGHLLAERCERLIQSGLRRINISLDSLDPARFEKITRTKSFSAVMAGIDAAQRSRLAPAKVNAVLVRGINDDEVEAFAAFGGDRE